MNDRAATDSAGRAHLDPTRLADLDEGLLAAADARAARAHLQGCARCADVHAGLADVRTRLRALPPVTLPREVAGRIDAALAAAGAESSPLAHQATPATEPGERTTARAASSGGPRTEPVRLDAHRRTRDQRRMRVLQAAAAVVLVVGGGALGFQALNGVGSGGDDADAGAALGEAPAELGPDSSTAPQRGRVTASDTDYTPEQLAGQVRGLLDRVGMTARGDPNNAVQERAKPNTTAGDIAALPNPAAVRSCVDALTNGPAQRPLAVDIATFRGRPAAVVVLRTPGDRLSLDVFVVERRCSADADRTLYFQRIAR